MVKADWTEDALQNVYKCSAGEWEDFTKTRAWSVYRQVLMEAREEVRTHLEVTEGEEFRKWQGRANALTFALDVPEVLLEDLKENQQKENDDVRADSDADSPATE
jgi:hypothetical protein